MGMETISVPRENLPNIYTDVSAREIDFVTRFADSWQSLQEVLGIVRPIKKQSGTRLVSYKTTVTLTNGQVPAGAIIPYSKVKTVETVHDDLTLQKYAKAVPIEDVDKYGDEIAVQKSDEAFLNELQTVVLTSFYEHITDDTDAITGTYDTFQMAVAMAIGSVKDKFKKMRKNASKITVFVNTLDAYKYLGADVVVNLQTAFGIDYLKNVLGADTLILSSEIEEGKVIAVPNDNIVNYYVDPSTEFSKLGLTYTTDGETNLIGFHAQGNYNTAVGESYAVMGMTLWAEYSDAIAIMTVSAGNESDGNEETPAGNGEETPAGNEETPAG